MTVDVGSLMDDRWRYGGSIDPIAATISQGRPGGTPSWKGKLTEQQIWQLAAYVRTLSHPDELRNDFIAAQGKPLYEGICVACHGIDGKGNPLLGAPNLTDAVWLYGNDEATLTQTVTAGRTGQMPAWGEKLGEQRIKLLAAYVTRLAQESSR